MKKILWAIIASLSLAACTSVNIENAYKNGTSVPLEKVSSTSVGSIIYSEFDYMSNQGARISNNFQESVGVGKIYVPAGAILYSVKIDNQPAFCTKDLTYHDPLTGPFRSVCFFDTNNDHSFEKRWVNPGGMPFVKEIPVVPYVSTEVTADASGFKNELIYQGIDNNVIKLSYREYKDTFARPAFQQDLTYTLEKNKPTTISFRGARIEVISANNNTITYKVLSKFDS